MRLVQRPFDVSKKRITTEQLKPGMFLVGVYQSWWKSPFFRHHRIIKNQHEIDLLLQAGIQEVMIDTSLGPDPGEQEEQLHIRDESPASSSPLDGELGSMEFHDQEGMHTDPLSDLSASWEAARLFREDAIFAVEGIFEGLKTGTTIDHPQFRQTVKHLLDQVLSQGAILAEAVLIQSLKQFDKSLYAHVVDVAVLSILAGVRLGLEEETLGWLTVGALFHDVGYIRLPRNILRRKTRLIGEEQHLFKRHPEFGLKLLESCPAISDESRRIVIEHHESQNGKGYPKGLCGEAVSNLSYLVGSVDRFDGLVSGWGQQTPIPSALALRGLYKEVREGGLSLTAVESLIKCLGVYPIGTVVGLSTGEQAIVLKGNPQEPMKPLIKLLTDSMGQSQGTMPLIDLASPDPHSSDRSIASILDPTACQVDVVRHLQ